MRRKNLLTAMACAAVVSAATIMTPFSVMAEETELTTEAAEADTEAGDEESTEAEDSTETEEELEMLERPDYQASEYVELGEYKGLKVTLAPIEVKDEEVLDQIRVNAGSDILEELIEGEVAEGDIANIDYEGKLDGEAFDGGTAKGYDLEIGSGSFIDGFEDGLVGVSVGETVDLPLTFPENYTPELAGKDVIFTVTVNSVKRMPELTDELTAEVTDGAFETADAYKESVREDLIAAEESARDGEIRSALMQQVAENSEIKDYPKEMVEYATTNMKNFYKKLADSNGMEFADFLEAYMGMDEESFDSEVELVVKENLQAELYMKAIAEAEEMELTDEEYEQKCQEYMEMYGYETKEELIDAYGEPTLRVSALQDKVLEMLVETAEVTEAESDETEAAEETEAATEAAEAVTEDAAETETEE